MNIRGRNRVTPEFNMASMTDVVFLLLIFFMIASTLAKYMDTVDINLPNASGKSENRKTVSVSISKDLVYFLDGKKVTERSLERRIKEALSGQDKPTLVLRADKTVPVDNVVKVMDIANKNRIKVILAVKPK
ncbi:ExbD/TolR family protein [Sungkyunkwania multivorans]|uniref:ExbD/TolR family protein n=1 Tax=Sungkyunkwania multivorans TaxID=1173618 RepID=A0ABW3D0I4_9FLAO